jgi:hypothetical protein
MIGAHHWMRQRRGYKLFERLYLVYQECQTYEKLIEMIWVRPNAVSDCSYLFLRRKEIMHDLSQRMEMENMRQRLPFLQALVGADGGIKTENSKPYRSVSYQRQTVAYRREVSNGNSQKTPEFTDSIPEMKIKSNDHCMAASNLARCRAFL